LRKEIWVTAVVAAICLVTAAAILASGVLDNDDHDPDGSDGMVLMTGIRVEATGPPNLTAYGLLVIPVNVTNLMDRAVDFRSMNITLRLADGSEVPATCNGPESVAPLATEQFLIIVSSEEMLDISAVHIVNGFEYLNLLVPAGNDPSNDDDPDDTEKNEPFVRTSLEDGRPFGPDPFPPDQLTYGMPVEGTLDTWVEEKADAARIGIIVYFVGLSNDTVFVNASYGGGEPQWVNLYGDGLLGCYGMLMTDPSNVVGEKAWTWTYDSSGAEYYNITLSVTTYSLGTHEMRISAYDQDTGEKISGVEVTNYTVLGTGGQYNDLNYMLDSAADTDMMGAFAPGGTYSFNITDTCRFPQYHGEVRSVLYFPYAESVSIVNGDGTEAPLTGDNYAYNFTWECSGGGEGHTTHLLVRIGAAGVPPSEYPNTYAIYHLEDVETGQVMSHVGPDGHPGIRIELKAG
jgi:hypothetical protein